MERLIKGDVVVAYFPYSDFTQQKRRPALVLAALPGNDLIVCQITSQQVRNQYSISISYDDFSTGSLRQNSNIRPDKIITIDRQLIIYKIGILKSEIVEKVVRKIVEILGGIT